MEPIHFFYPQTALKIHESNTSVTLLSIRENFGFHFPALCPLVDFHQKQFHFYLLQVSTNATFHPRIGASRFTLIYLVLNSLCINFAIAIDSIREDQVHSVRGVLLLRLPLSERRVKAEIIVK